MEITKDYIGVRQLGVSQHEGIPFWGSHHKDCSILGLYWGPPISGNRPYPLSKPIMSLL